jgi:hypothetical protein
MCGRNGQAHLLLDYLVQARYRKSGCEETEGFVGSNGPRSNGPRGYPNLIAVQSPMFSSVFQYFLSVNQPSLPEDFSG